MRTKLNHARAGVNAPDGLTELIATASEWQPRVLRGEPPLGDSGDYGYGYDHGHGHGIGVGYGDGYGDGSGYGDSYGYGDGHGDGSGEGYWSIAAKKGDAA